MHQPQAFQRVAANRSVPSAPSLRVNAAQWLFAGLSATVLLVMLMTYVNLVKLQVARGEQMRQQWNSFGAAASISQSPPAAEMQLAVKEAAGRSAPFRF